MTRNLSTVHPVCLCFWRLECSSPAGSALVSLSFTERAVCPSFNLLADSGQLSPPACRPADRIGTSGITPSHICHPTPLVCPLPWTSPCASLPFPVFFRLSCRWNWLVRHFRCPVFQWAHCSVNKPLLSQTEHKIYSPLSIFPSSRLSCLSVSYCQNYSRSWTEIVFVLLGLHEFSVGPQQQM